MVFTPHESAPANFQEEHRSIRVQVRSTVRVGYMVMDPQRDPGVPRRAVDEDVFDLELDARTNGAISGCRCLLDASVGGMLFSTEDLGSEHRCAFRSWTEATRQHLTGAGVQRPEAEQLATMFVATIAGSFVLSRAQRRTGPLMTAGRYVAQLAERAINDAVRS